MKKAVILGSCIILLIAISLILIYVFTYERAYVSKNYGNYSQEEYMEFADLVVAVKVIKNVETKYTNPDFTIKSTINDNEIARNELVTYSLVKVKDVIKGDVKIDEEILIKEFGGKYGNTKIVVDNSEVVKKGEEYIMFLFKDTSDIEGSSKECYELSNPYRSKFKYSKDINQYVNVNDNSQKFSIQDFKAMYEEIKIQQ